MTPNAPDPLHLTDDDLVHLLDGAPMAVVILGPDLRVRRFTPLAQELLGLLPTDVGRSFLGIRLLLDDLPDLGSLLAKGTDGIAAEHDVRDPNGRWYSLRLRSYRMGQNEVEGVIVMLVDIDDRKRSAAALRVSEVRFWGLFETSRDGLLILDAESHKITHVNPYLSDLVGCPAARFLGKEVWEICVLSDQDASRAAMQRLLEDRAIRFESLPLAGHDGRLHAVEVLVMDVALDDAMVILLVHANVTERSRLEWLVRRLAVESSDLRRRKDEFVAMMSHELRGPLTPMATAVQLLGMQHRHENAIQQEARGIIERQLAHLQHLVDDLLEVSRITTGQLQLHREPVLAGDIVQRALANVRPLLDARRHEVTVSLPKEPIGLHADAARLEQVVAQLLTNAARFTDQGGRVSLVVQREGDRCVVRVRDTGVGITPALLPRVFDLFTQEPRSLDRSEGHLGIGLALVRRLTELHGGSVEAHSRLGQGSEFVVRLPLAADPPVPAVPEPGANGPISRALRVLVVDDNVDTRKGFSMLLEAAGHEVRTAHDGAAGLLAALANPPHVVLLDIGLPELNGYEVARRIRQEPSLANVVLVALTGYGQATDRQQALQAGFDHHLVKPPDFARLEQILAGVAANAG